MKRLAIAVAASLFIVAAVLLLTFLNRGQMGKPASASDIHYSVEMGHPLLLDSEEDCQQNPEAYFVWDGSLSVTLVSCELYSDMAAAGIDAKNSFYREIDSLPGTGWVYLQCELKVDNIGATPRADDGLFDVSTFGLFIEGGSNEYYDSSLKRPVDYFDGCPESSDEKKKLLFELPKGEGKTFHIGFFVQESDLSKPMYICAGLWSGATKYRLYIPDGLG